MINKGECILVRDSNNLTALCDALAAEGYRCCSTKTLAEVLSTSVRNTRYEGRMGVRWRLDDEFPNCLAFCPLEIYDDLASSGKILDEHYSKDRGITYKVRWFEGDLVEVGDLL